MKVLIVGWFSFSNGHATAGDLLSGNVACEWIEAAGYSCDIALAPLFDGGVDWRTVDPDSYAYVVFVCGPFQKAELEAEFLSYFSQCRIIGLNLSMLLPLDAWNPFDLLIERDSTAGAHPDMVFYSHEPLVPVIGVCLVEPYQAGNTDEANDAIRRLIASREMAIVPIDTRLDIANSAGLRPPSEIESLIARVDVLITTRLHGSVLALKNGVPVIAIDPEAGGAKIRRQMELIGWPATFNVDALSDEQLQAALRYCLTPEARSQARTCYAKAIQALEVVRDELIAVLNQPEQWVRKDDEQISIVSARTFDPPSEAPVEPPPPIPTSWMRQVARQTKRLIGRIMRRGALHA
jgi:hypothetical protein